MIMFNSLVPGLNTLFNRNLEVSYTNLSKSKLRHRYCLFEFWFYSIAPTNRNIVEWRIFA